MLHITESPASLLHKKANRHEPRKSDVALYRERNLVARLICKLKQ